MNKKVIILMANMMFATTSMLPTTHQQEDAALLEYIYAADKVGELAQFADDTYIEFLEKNSEELLKEKRNYNGMFKKSGYRNCALVASFSGVLFGLLFGVKSVGVSLYAFSAISAVPRIASLLDKKSINPEVLSKLHDILTCNILKTIAGFMVVHTGLRIADHIEQIGDDVEQDASIDALVEKNESIVAKLKEIKQTA